MCDFVSYKMVNKNGTNVLYYLTDEEVFSEKGKKIFADTKDNDVLGHGAVDKYYGLNGKGEDHEVRDFWNTEKLPPVIAEKIKDFDKYWGKMFTSGAFQTDDLEYIINHGPQEWKEKARKQLAIQKFTLLKSFSLTVPKDYNHNTQLSTLKPKNFYYFNDAVTDKNFENATQKLVPGKTYTVKIMSIGSRATSDECLDTYKREKAILVGAQGLSLAYQVKKEEFPSGKWLVSFDEKKALWKDADGYLRVPYVIRLSVGDYEFNLGYFESGWNGGYCLLLFCDGE